jgi:glycosyltransferase involved in cell wall biosynthesis
VHDLGEPDRAAALIVDPSDVDDIAAGLAAVLTDETVRADLARRGQVYSAGRTWRAAANQHLGLWRSLV